MNNRKLSGSLKYVLNVEPVAQVLQQFSNVY